jgi:hypothetical protein
MIAERKVSRFQGFKVSGVSRFEFQVNASGLRPTDMRTGNPKHRNWKLEILKP